MKPGFTSVVGVCLILSAAGASRAAPVYPVHELWFGLGGGASFEKNVFNVPDDLESHPEMILSLGYIWNWSPRHAIGVHMFGGTETWPPRSVQTPGGPELATFELDTYNLGVRYRYTFSRGTLAPYVFGGVGAATGFIDSNPTGSLTYNGWSACVGPGVSVGLGRHFKLSAEGFGSFGGANWESKPFTNSSNRSFNPSLVGGTANLSVVWGEPRASRPPTEPPVVADSSLASSAVADSSLASSAVATPENALGNSVGEILLVEGLIVLLSSAAYADDNGGLLAGLTGATALLGSAAGAGSDLKNPKSPWIMLGGLLALAGGVVVMGQSGASDDALFVTSVVSWNVIALGINRAERNYAKTHR